MIGIYRYRNPDSKQIEKLKFTYRLGLLNFARNVYKVFCLKRFPNSPFAKSLNLRNQSMERLERQLDIVTFMRQHLLMKSLLWRMTTKEQRIIAKHVSPFIVSEKKELDEKLELTDSDKYTDSGSDVNIHEHVENLDRARDKSDLSRALI
jgi:hypothetical protein